MREPILHKGILAVLGLSILACQPKEICFDPLLDGGPVFYASMEQVDTPDDRVYADVNLRLRWHAEDLVSIFNKNTYNQQYRFDGETGDDSGTFTRTGSEVPGDALPSVYAVYPYAQSTSISKDCEIQLTLPMEQALCPGGFGPGANAMVSVTEDDNLLFKSIGGFLAVKLYGDNTKVSSLAIRGNRDEKLSGNAYVSVSPDGYPSVEMDMEASIEVCLNSWEPITLGTSEENYTEVWFVLPPITFEEGFSITVTGPDGSVFTKTTHKSVSITRNHLTRMSPFEVELPFWEEGTVPPDNEIWYKTSNDEPIRVVSESFADQGIISESYSGGKGILTFSGPLKIVKSWAFSNVLNRKDLSQIWLPDSIETIEDYSFSHLDLQVLHLPKSLENISGLAFQGSTIARFTGDGRVQNQGKFYVKDNTLVLSATIDDSELTIPGTVSAISGHAFWLNNPNLRILRLEEGITTIGPYAFSGCRSLEEVYLPSTLERSGYSWFDYCDGIRQFHGPEGLVSSDGRTLYRYIPFYVGDVVDSYRKTIMNVAKSGLTHYEVTEDVDEIDPESFCRASDLRSVAFSRADVVILGDTFDECYNLEEITGPGSSDDHRAYVYTYCDTRIMGLFAGKGISSYIVKDCDWIQGGVFAYWPDLKEVMIDEGVVLSGSTVFWGAQNLEKVEFPSTYRSMGNISFVEANRIKEIWFHSLVPPEITDNGGGLTTGLEDKKSQLTIYVPAPAVGAYENDAYWGQYSGCFRGYDYEDVYVSSDFSSDGTVVQMQTGTAGKGIHVVLMGDGFSDRQIADGMYGNVMRRAMDAFFEEEPYRSFKDCFDISYVNAVSYTEGYDHEGQALGTFFGEGTFVDGDREKVIDYALKVIPESELDQTVIIVLMNKDAYAGSCTMYRSYSGNYGDGLSIAFFPINSDGAVFRGLVSHEAGGHGFAKLADEYSYENMGAISGADIAERRLMESFGWWKNIDFTGDPSLVKWSRFIEDSRYASENIGCYEGGLTYRSGVWRPTENSIMNTNVGGFNAPSRYAIWYRINKLAYGEEWNGTFEDFVAYDAVNRTPSAVARRKARRNLVEKPLPPLAPPVVVSHSWREDLELR